MTAFDYKANINTEVYRKPIDTKLIKQDPKGNKYISAYDMIKIADEAFSSVWSADVVRTWNEQILDYDIIYFAQVEITVPGLGSRTAIGGVSLRDTLFYKEAKKKSLSELVPSDLQPTRASDMYKSAVSDGMKKALSYFFIAEEVYTADDQDKMETSADERPAYGVRPKKTVAATPVVPKVSLNETNKTKFQEVMKEKGWKTNQDINKAIMESGLQEINDENIELFIKYHTSEKALPE